MMLSGGITKDGIGCDGLCVHAVCTGTSCALVPACEEGAGGGLESTWCDHLVDLGRTDGHQGLRGPLAGFASACALEAAGGSAGSGARGSRGREDVALLVEHVRLHAERRVSICELTE